MTPGYPEEELPDESQPRITRAGDRSLLVVCGEGISLATHREVLRATRALAGLRLEGTPLAAPEGRMLTEGVPPVTFDDAPREEALLRYVASASISCGALESTHAALWAGGFARARGLARDGLPGSCRGFRRAPWRLWKRWLPRCSPWGYRI